MKRSDPCLELRSSRDIPKGSYSHWSVLNRGVARTACAFERSLWFRHDTGQNEPVEAQLSVAVEMETIGVTKTGGEDSRATLGGRV